MGAELKPYAVVTMQETFTSYAKGMAKDAAFPYQHYQNNWDLLNLNSGLMTLTKHPIVKTDFIKFKKAADADAFANKGVLLTRLNVAGLGEVDIYNTHYQSKASRSAIRVHDNEMLEAIIKRNDKGNPTFVMGDLNTQPGSPEYQDLMKRLNPRDSWAERYPGVPGYTASPENPRRDAESGAKRIDYVFVLPNTRFDIRIESLQVMFAEPVQGVVLSDHYGLSGRFSVTPRTP
jgi:endonuclease/exonuclease/phosphatase family metal-dependent hydrolase